MFFLLLQVELNIRKDGNEKNFMKEEKIYYFYRPLASF